MLQLINKIYPIKFLIIVFTPIVLGLIIDYELFNARYIFINLVWMALFTVPRLLFARMGWLYKLGCVLFFIFGFIEIVHWISIKGPITITSLLVVFNTNIQEAMEFVALKASLTLLILLPYTWLLVLALKSKTDKLTIRKNRIIVLLVFVVSVVFIGENAIKGRFIRKGSPQIIKVAYSFVDKLNLYKEVAQKNYPKNVQVASNRTEKKQLFVLILGESCNRSHMSVYGYNKETTPLLDSRNDVFVYTDVVAPYSNTLNSIYSILTESSLDKPVDIGTAVDLIDIFYSASYKTYWISNQSPIGVWDNMVTVMANKVDHCKFVNLSSNSSYEAVLSSSYDNRVFEPFNNALIENDQNKLIIVQLMGSHSSYAKRYPRSFRKFKIAGNKKEKTIAHYDNSIYYNDFIVDSLLNSIMHLTQETNLVASAIYIADHGENVYDEGNRVGHDYSNKLPKANVEIPFIVWLSDAYKKHVPEKHILVKSNNNLPFVSDDLFHAVLDLNDLTYSNYKPNRSIFNSVFDKNRIRILEDGRNYDKN